MSALKKITEGLLEIGQWIVILGSFFEKAPGPVKDKLPMFLGLSLEDERIWDHIWTFLESWEKEIWTLFLNDYCEDYESNHLRHVVVGMPKAEVKEESGMGKDKKVKTTQESRAVPFLKQLAKLMQDEGMRVVYEQLTAGGTIVSDPFHQKVINRWREGTTWFKKTLLDPFTATSLRELQEKALGKLKEVDLHLANSIPTVESYDPGFMKGIFGFNFSDIQKIWRKRGIK